MTGREGEFPPNRLGIPSGLTGYSDTLAEKLSKNYDAV